MNIDWQLIEAFVQVAEAGSVSAAAKASGISQPTLSRHVAQLEEELGMPLFVRHVRGVELTEGGLELLASASDVRERVHAFLRQASGLRAEPSGAVRISANEPIGVYVLPPCLAALRRSHPRISLELVVDNSSADLSRREADIAVRMYKPVQPDLVARHLGSLELGLYASRDYLAAFGTPTDPREIANHTWIGLDRDQAWLNDVRRLGMAPEQFAFRTDSLAAHIQAAQQGVGIAGLHTAMAKGLPDMVRVLPQLELPPLGVWLVVHRDVRANPAVRVVLDALTDTLQRYVDAS